MTDDSRKLLARPSRQSPLAIFFFAWQLILQLNLVQIAAPIALLITSRSLIVGALLVAAIVGWIGVALVAWWRHKFWVVDDEIRVAKGVIAHESKAIPLGRIQSVAFQQTVVHRLLGLVSITLDTAGSREPELELIAIDKARARALQRLAAEAGGAGLAQASPSTGEDGETTSGAEVGSPVGAVAEETVVRRTAGELLRVGLSTWPLAGFVLLSPIVGWALDVLDAFGRSVGPSIPADDTLGNRIGEASTGKVIIWSVAIIVLVVAVGWLFQIIRVFLSEWNLTVVLSSDGLRRESGLLSRTSKASRLIRIQDFRFSQGLWERVFGIFNVRFGIIGEGDLNVVGSSIEEVERLRSLAFDPRSDPGPAVDRSVSPLQMYQWGYNTFWCTVGLEVLVWVVLTNVEDLTWSPWWLLGFLAVPLAVGIAWWRWRGLHWGFNQRRFITAYRMISQTTTEMDLVKVQKVTVKQSPFQWRRALATIELGVADGVRHLVMIEQDEAEQLRDTALAAVEFDHRRWM